MQHNCTFLPEDYKAPRASGSYMKIQEGENKIRILSSPVIGWEDWVNSKPVRYKMDDKPQKWADAANPGRHFWALIVWNYNEERIQIMHLTQGSIRKALEALSKDSDWGAPFFYDIKITKSGEGLKTKYSVNPLPHKPLADHIQEAFEENHCNLDALFMGLDPFGQWENYTPAFYEKPQEKPPESELITINELNELIKLIGDDEEYKDKLLTNIKKMGFNSFAEITSDKYQAILKSVHLHNEKRLKEEMAKNKVPF